MTQYTIRGNGICLYVCIASNHIHVERFRTIDYFNYERICSIASWYVNPPSPSQPSMTKMELVRMIQKISGDVHNGVIDAVLHFTATGKKGDEASTNSTSSSQDNQT